MTVLSFDERSGDIVDADIVLNAKHELAALPRAAGDEDEDDDDATKAAYAAKGSRPKDAHALADDGATYDVAWVLAHEMGHAMGLGDDPSAPDALMFPYVRPDLAGPVAPTRADLDGIEALYEGGGFVPDGASSGAGAGTCSGAAMGAGGHGVRSARYAGAVVLAMTALGLARRRRRGAAVSGALALVCLLPTVEPRTRAWARAMDAEREVLATVTEARASRGEDGLVRTDLRLLSRSSATLTMHAEPASVIRTAVRGGSHGGIRQQVGREVVPAVGTQVRVVLRKAALPSFFRVAGVLPGSASGDIVVRTKGR